jgi:hypothetical protein
MRPRGRRSNTRRMTIEASLPIGAYLLLEPDGGEQLRFLGDSHMRLKVDGADTGDALSFYSMSRSPVSPDRRNTFTTATTKRSS